MTCTLTLSVMAGCRIIVCCRSDVKPGEVLALLNSGAYSLAQMFPYNGRPLPAAVMVREGGKAELIRKRDTYEDSVDE